MKRKDADNTAEIVEIEGEDKFSNTASKMVDIVVRIKEDDTFGN